jgi:membrane fusion protein, multidrug efflux system
MKINKHLFTISILVLTLASSCGSKDKKSATGASPGGAKQPPMAVEVIIVDLTPINNLIEVPGSLLAYESTEIFPELSGRLVFLNVKEGAMVGKGTLLAKLYDGDMQARLSTLSVQIKKYEVQLKIAQQTEDRSSKLLRIQGISQQDYDLSLLQVNNIMADIAITRAQMAEIRANMTKLNIYAPFAGKLGLKNISPGAYVTPATNITTLNKVDQLKLQFSIPEKYGAMIKMGQDIVFSVDGSTKTFRAAVMATEGSISEETRSLTVRSVVTSSDPDLIPGAFANVKITLGNNQNALMIPNSSLIPQGRKKIVYLFNNNKAISREVTTGVRDSLNIQVLNGLKLGDTVITSGLLFLKPEADVKILKVNQ